MSRARPLPFGLLAIGDRGQITHAAAAAALAAGGARLALLLRDPALREPERLAWAAEILPLCRALGALLLVHGSAALARAAGADGVHLPERGESVAAARRVLGVSAWVGASRHDAVGVRAALAAGADYATLGPVFAVPGKGAPLGVEGLRAVCGAEPGAVVALGGIAPATAAECRAAGAAAVAAIRGVWEGEVAENVRGYLA